MAKSKEVLFCDHCEMETFHEDGKCFECGWIPVKGELSMKPICIYELKLLKELKIKNDENSLMFSEYIRGGKRNELGDLPTCAQKVKLHRLNACDVIHTEVNENDIVKEQESRIGPGITNIKDDYIHYNKPVKRITTISFFGIYYDVSVPEFIKEKLDPAYIKEIEFNKINEGEKRYEMEKILHGSIFKLIWYRLKRWWRIK